MLQAVQLPAGVADLDAGLADVNRETLTHLVGKLLMVGGRRIWIVQTKLKGPTSDGDDRSE